jgi:hypothetical protein
MDNQLLPLEDVEEFKAFGLTLEEYDFHIQQFHMVDNLRNTVTAKGINYEIMAALEDMYPTLPDTCPLYTFTEDFSLTNREIALESISQIVATIFNFVGKHIVKIAILLVGLIVMLTGRWSSSNGTTSGGSGGGGVDATYARMVETTKANSEKDEHEIKKIEPLILPVINKYLADGHLVNRIKPLLNDLIYNQSETLPKVQAVFADVFQKELPEYIKKEIPSVGENIYIHALCERVDYKLYESNFTSAHSKTYIGAEYNLLSTDELPLSDVEILKGTSGHSLKDALKNTTVLSVILSECYDNLSEEVKIIKEVYNDISNPHEIITHLTKLSPLVNHDNVLTYHVTLVHLYAEVVKLGGNAPQYNYTKGECPLVSPVKPDGDKFWEMFFTNVGTSHRTLDLDTPKIQGYYPRGETAKFKLESHRQYPVLDKTTEKDIKALSVTANKILTQAKGIQSALITVANEKIAAESNIINEREGKNSDIYWHPGEKINPNLSDTSKETLEYYKNTQIWPPGKSDHPTTPYDLLRERQLERIITKQVKGMSNVLQVLKTALKLTDKIVHYARIREAYEKHALKENKQILENLVKPINSLVNPFS